MDNYYYLSSIKKICYHYKKHFSMKAKVSAGKTRTILWWNDFKREIDHQPLNMK